SVGMEEPAYTKVTVDFTRAAANAMAAVKPDMTFCFVSGRSTDSTEKGAVMWARVKGRAENLLFAMPFKTWAFRPGYIQPMKGVKSKTGWYNAVYAVFGPLYPILSLVFGSAMTTTENVGLAMIEIAINGDTMKILENPDINRVAGRARSFR